MSSAWPIMRLGDLSDLITKGTTPTSVGHAFVPDGINFVKVESITENCQFIESKLAHITQECHDTLRRSQLKSGDILFSIAGALGRTALVTEDIVPANINQALAIIRLKPSNDVLPAFVLQALATGFVLDQIEKFKGGVAQQNLSLAQVQEFQIPLPPIPDQKRIIGILDEAFDGITTAKANAEKNLQNARALFESHLQSVFTQRGEHPVVHICEVGKVFDGPHATPKTVDSGPIFLGIGALQDGQINLGATRHVTPDDFRQWTRRVKPQADDIVFSYETRLGQVAIIPEGLECCLGRRMGLVRVDKKRLDPRFFVYQYISPPFREFLNSKTVRGATVDRIALKEFPSFPISLPNIIEQKHIADAFDIFRAKTQRLESIYQQKLAALDALKKSLLDQAFTGAL